MSVREVLDDLAGIEETVLLYPSTGGRPRARRMLTERVPTQDRHFDLFSLHRYASRGSVLRVASGEPAPDLGKRRP